MARNPATFVPISGDTYIVRGTMHQATLIGDEQLADYLQYEACTRTRFTHSGGTPYERADVLRSDGSVCAELHRIHHA